MRVFFAYHEVVNESFMVIFPKGTRWFDRPNGCWMIKPELLTMTRELLDDYFDVYLDAPPENPPVGDPIDGLFDMVAPWQREMLFKKLTPVLHPDTGGTEELMKGLNRAHERWT